MTHEIDARYQTGTPVWSCCFHPTNANYLLCGTSQAKICLFDVRMTQSCVCDYTIPHGRPLPIHSLLPLHSSLDDPSDNGVISFVDATLDAVTTLSLSSSVAFSEGEMLFPETRGTYDLWARCRSDELLDPLGSCTGLALDPTGPYYVSSHRQQPLNSPSVNSYGRLETGSFLPLGQVHALSAQRSMTKPVIFTYEEHPYVVLADEPSATVS